MSVRIERSNRILTVIQSRPEARNAVDPAHAQALYEAFVAFDADATADVAVFWAKAAHSAPARISKALPRAASPRRKTPPPIPRWNFPRMAARRRAGRWGRRGCG